MIDIHCHILNGVDDGAGDMIDSLEMLRIAEECGVTDIIATPHCSAGIYDNYNDVVLNDAFDNFFERAARNGSRVELHKGMEVFASANVLDLFERGKLLTLAGSRYMLVECAFSEDPAFMTDVLSALLHNGVHPIIAHPERYYFLNDKLAYAFNWVDMGCSLQINTGSVIGQFGRKSREISMVLLGNDAVQLCASDAHGVIMRSPDMQYAYEFVGTRFSYGYADLIFNENPRRIIEDRRLRFHSRDNGLPMGRILTDDEFWNEQ